MTLPQLKANVSNCICHQRDKPVLISRIMGKISSTYNQNKAIDAHENNYHYQPSFSSNVGTYPSIVYNQNHNKVAQKSETNKNDKVYTKSDLRQLSKSDLVKIIETFSKSELINIIIQRQNRKQKKVDDQLKKRNAQHESVNKVFINPHEKNIKPVNFGERMATDYEKIEKQREIIRQLKQKRKVKMIWKHEMQREVGYFLQLMHMKKL